jgi:stage IV sporulation protein FB
MARLSAAPMMDRGYLTIGRFRGVPLRLHWTLPLGALIFGGFRFVPAFWVGFFLLVLGHELGHAFFVQRYRHQVLSVDVTGFGGLCRWVGRATPYERAVIAWGGVLVQGLILLVAVAVLFAAGPPRSVWSVQLADVFTRTNLWLIGLNLLPLAPLDGKEAWPLVGHLADRLRSRRPPPPPPPRPDDAELRKLAESFRRVGERAGEARRAGARR